MRFVFMSLCLYINETSPRGLVNVGDVGSIGVFQGAVRRVGQLYGVTTSYGKIVH